MLIHWTNQWNRPYIPHVQYIAYVYLELNYVHVSTYTLKRTTHSNIHGMHQPKSSWPHIVQQDNLFSWLFMFPRNQEGLLWVFIYPCSQNWIIDIQKILSMKENRFYLSKDIVGFTREYYSGSNRTCQPYIMNHLFVLFLSLFIILLTVTFAGW